MYNKILILDVETNGLIVGKDKITEYGWVRVEEGNAIDSGSFLINQPNLSIPEHVQELTGITEKRAREEGIDVNKAIEIIKEQYLWADLIIAYNGKFDINHITHFINVSIDREVDHLDPLLMVADWKKWTPNSRHKLTDACKFFDVDLVNAHTAEADCKATFELLQKMESFGVPTEFYINFWGQYKGYPWPEDKLIPKHVQVVPLSYRGDGSISDEIAIRKEKIENDSEL